MVGLQNHLIDVRPPSDRVQLIVEERSISNLVIWLYKSRIVHHIRVDLNLLINLCL